MIRVRHIEQDQLAAQVDQCLDHVESGGEIVIVRDGRRVCRLVAARQSPPPNR